MQIYKDGYMTEWCKDMILCQHPQYIVEENAKYICAAAEVFTEANYCSYSQLYCRSSAQKHTVFSLVYCQMFMVLIELRPFLVIGMES